MKEKNRWNWQWERFYNNEKNIFLDWISPTRLEDYKDKIVLDAGCGNGECAKIVSDYAKKVVGLEKYAASAARANVADNKKIEIIEGDIENFTSAEKFDAIYSVGVLHHLENPTLGFLNLLANLKDGGFINIWVYAREGNGLMVNFIEPLKFFLILKIPLPMLKIITHLLTISLYFAVWTIYFIPAKMPYMEYLKKFRKHSYLRNFMNVFDKLNAPLTHWITKEEVESWFSGLDGVSIKHYNGISWSGFGIKKQSLKQL